MKVRHHAAVAGVHARAVRVEYPRHLDLQLVLTVIVEEQRFRATLAFVAAGARPDRVDVAPIVLGLRMDRGVAVNFGSRGLENRALEPLGEPEHVDRAVHARLGRLHRIVLVMDWRGGTGEIADLIDLDVERQGHVVPQQFEPGIADEMRGAANGNFADASPSPHALVDESIVRDLDGVFGGVDRGRLSSAEAATDRGALGRRRERGAETSRGDEGAGRLGLHFVEVPHFDAPAGADHLPRESAGLVRGRE